MKFAPLSDFKPAYLDVGGRERMGISLECPSREPPHRAVWGEHRINLWFASPADDSGPNRDGAPHLWIHMGTLNEPAHFTMYDAWTGPMLVPGHWSGYIVEGRVFTTASYGGER